MTTAGPSAYSLVSEQPRRSIGDAGRGRAFAAQVLAFTFDPFGLPGHSVPDPTFLRHCRHSQEMLRARRSLAADDFCAVGQRLGSVLTPVALCDDGSEFCGSLR